MKAAGRVRGVMMGEEGAGAQAALGPVPRDTPSYLWYLISEFLSFL